MREYWRRGSMYSAGSRTHAGQREQPGGLAHEAPLRHVGPAPAAHVRRHGAPHVLLRRRIREALGEPWNGVPAVRQLSGLPPETLALPLHGHSRGHAAIAVDTGRGWLARPRR